MQESKPFKMNNKLFGSLLIAFFGIICFCHESNATEYPAPPKAPENFDNPEDIRRYLNSLHQYYTVVGKLKTFFSEMSWKRELRWILSFIGRPRFGKRSSLGSLSTLSKALENDSYGPAQVDEDRLDVSSTLFKQIDRNQDGVVSFAEFNGFISKNLKWTWQDSLKLSSRFN